MVITAWPFRPRFQLEPGGIRIAWLFVKERVAWEDVLAVRLGEDDRRDVVGKSLPV
jgi:hypothetical protein